MAILHSDNVCPYCLEELTNKDLKYICPICGEEVTASAYQIMMNITPRCKNRDCHRAFATRRACRKCNHDLPPDILEYSKCLRFSLIGITGSGKTNFLTTMIHELKATEDFPLVISWMDPQTGLLYQQNENLVYNLKERLEPSPPGLPPQPQQWKIRDRSKMTDRTIPSYSLTIFDGAGEDCQHTDPVISRYISGSKELVILFDPLALPAFSRKLSKEAIMRSTVAEHGINASAHMVNEIANYIRASCNIRPTKLIDKDVAIVFTKIDEVADSFGFGTVCLPSPHIEKRAFVQEDSDSVDREIREWMKQQGENEFLNEIDTNFNPKRVRYFGVSSFGTVPEEDGSPKEVKPHRILDPLLWMLANENIFPKC